MPDPSQGTCESRNAGTRNGTRNGSKMRAARYHHAQGVFIHWNGLDLPKNLFSSVGQKLSILIYSLKLLAEPAFVSFLESVEVKGHVHI